MTEKKSDPLTAADVSKLIYRLTIPTLASTAWHHDYNAQNTHVSFLKRADPKFHPRQSVSSHQLDLIVERLQQPTKSTIEKPYAKNRFSDIIISHDDDPRFRPNFTVTHQELSPMVERLTKPTRSSTAWRYDFNCQQANLDYLISKDPCVGSRSIFRNKSRSESSKLSITDIPLENQNGQNSAAASNIAKRSASASEPKSVSPQELDKIIDRVTRPTASSEIRHGWNKKYGNNIYRTNRIDNHQEQERKVNNTVNTNQTVKVFQFAKAPKVKVIHLPNHV